MAALRYFFSLLMIPVTFVAAIASGLAFLAAYIPPEESGTIAFAGLAMPAILLVNVLILVYWAIQKRKWAFLPAAAILWNISFLLSIFQFHFSTPASPENTSFRIATYNVRGFRGWDKQNTQFPITDYLAEQSADIVCFQEYWNSPKMPSDSLCQLLHLPYYKAKYLPGSPHSGSVIFSKYPIIHSGQIPLGVTQNDAMWADIQIENQTFRVISCHLQTTNFSQKRKELVPSELYNNDLNQIHSTFRDVLSTLEKNFKIRAQQADLIRHVIDTTTYPVIVCGDFNDTPASYTYHRIKGDLTDGFRKCGNGYGYTFRGLRNLLRIDFILYSAPFYGLQYQSPDLPWSDHKPVLMELEIKPTH